MVLPVYGNRYQKCRRPSCEPEVAGSDTEVQNPEVAGSEGKVQQLEVAEDSDFSDSEVQGGVCKPEEQSLHAVLVAEVAGLVAYGLESRAVSEPSWMVAGWQSMRGRGILTGRTVLGVFRAD